MNYVLSRKFQKSFKKLSPKIKNKVISRFEIFTKNPFSPILNNHVLGGKKSGYRSINVTGDLRAIYITLNDNLVMFVNIGTHSELYS